MKKFYTILSATFLLCAPSFAQAEDNSNIEIKGHVRIDEESSKEAEKEEATSLEDEKAKYNNEINLYIDELDLSLEQKVQAKKIAEDGLIKREQVIKNIMYLYNQTREIEQKSMNEFEAILNPEQKDKFAELKNKQNEFRAKHSPIPVVVKEEIFVQDGLQTKK